MIPNQPKAKPPPHLQDFLRTHLPPAPYTPPTDACMSDRYIFVVQPEDGQHLWPKHVVVLYV